MIFGVNLRLGSLFLAVLFSWMWGVGFARGADRGGRTLTSDRDEQTLRELFAPGSAYAPLQVARPFDTGPQVGRGRSTPPPVDELRAPPPAEPPETGPLRIPPPAPELFDAYPLCDAYEWDSYEARVGQPPIAPKWFPCPWLWPFSNGQWTWIQGEGNTLGFVEFEKRLMFANSLFAPFRIIPGFMTRYVSGPNVTDLPPQLDELSIEVASTYQIGSVWTLDLGGRPGLNGDLSYVDGNTFRIQAHAVAAKELSTTTRGVIGFVYLDREDILALPVIGWIWQPNPTVKWELVFPRPRLAMSLGSNPDDSSWMYLKGELGGNSWTIERADGAHDVATYRDLRLIVGYETPFVDGMAAQLETGWVFARNLQYASGDPGYDPPDTFLIRAGLTF